MSSRRCSLEREDKDTMGCSSDIEDKENRDEIKEVSCLGK